jgi:hypothetical protein
MPVRDRRKKSVRKFFIQHNRDNVCRTDQSISDATPAYIPVPYFCVTKFRRESFNIVDVARILIQFLLACPGSAAKPKLLFEPLISKCEPSSDTSESVYLWVEEPAG